MIYNKKKKFATIQYVDPKTNATSTKKATANTSATVCTAADYKATLDKLAKERPLGLPLHFSFDQEGGIGSNLYFANGYLAGRVSRITPPIVMKIRAA